MIFNAENILITLY